MGGKESFIYFKFRMLKQKLNAFFPSMTGSSWICLNLLELPPRNETGHSILNLYEIIKYIVSLHINFYYWLIYELHLIPQS